MGIIFKDSDKPTGAETQRLWKFVFSLIIAVLGLFGLLALVFLLHDEIVSHFTMKRQYAMGLLSAAIVSGGLILLILGIRAKKQAIHESRKQEDKEPWLKREDWAAGRIISSSPKAVLVLWILVFFWCFGSAAISLVAVPPQLHQGNRAALICLIFPVIGLGLFVFAVRTSGAWRRFNRSIFEMSSVPAPAGGILSGKIQIPGVFRPKHGWHLVLSCVRRSTSGPVNNLRATDKILWQDEKWLCPDLPAAAPKTTAIPVFFQLPDDQPESTAETTAGVVWRLEAWARLPGPDFQASFEVPVFKLPEPLEPAADPTAPYHLSLDDIRKELQSQIRIVDLPQGREFVFPAGRNPGFAAGATMICLVWTVIVALLVVRHAPPLLPLVFGALDLFMLYFVFDLWARRSRVVITAEGIKIETAWPGFRKETPIKIHEAAGFFAEIGAPVGHLTYYDLKLRTRDGKELTLAKNLGHKPEADWLARQMTAAIRMAPATNLNA